MKDIVKLEAGHGVEDPNEGLVWYDITSIPVEGQAWSDPKHRYDRMTGRAEDMVREQVWLSGQCSTGLFLRFSSDTRCIAALFPLRPVRFPSAPSSPPSFIASRSCPAE